MGHVALASPPPAKEKIRFSDSSCPRAPNEEVFSEAVLVNADLTLRNVIVFVKSGLGDRVFAPPESATVDQKGCIYNPHVISVQTNQGVTFVNSDPTLHNVHAMSKVNRPFNVGMAVKGQRVTKYFPRPEIVKVKCDVHPWMSSYIGVFGHPFHAVTGDGGRFELKGLPAGTYEIEAWHETFGTSTQSVTLADGEAKQIDFRFGG